MGLWHQHLCQQHTPPYSFLILNHCCIPVRSAANSRPVSGLARPVSGLARPVSGAAPGITKRDRVLSAAHAPYKGELQDLFRLCKSVDRCAAKHGMHSCSSARVH